MQNGNKQHGVGFGAALGIKVLKDAQVSSRGRKTVLLLLLPAAPSGRIRNKVVLCVPGTVFACVLVPSRRNSTPLRENTLDALCFPAMLFHKWAQVVVPSTGSQLTSSGFTILMTGV